MYRRQVELGLDGDELAAHKARLFLRELLGRIDLKPEGRRGAVGRIWRYCYGSA
jgi:hypothetical protein